MAQEAFTKAITATVDKKMYALFIPTSKPFKMSASVVWRKLAALGNFKKHSLLRQFKKTYKPQLSQSFKVLHPLGEHTKTAHKRRKKW
ncbi:MAG: hypothetical protein C0514_08295 [Candidatus Puniceispirillum sp.]|nr:hypothetical protein [Candidatus Puniceispirillum sp.]